jgi:murein DD-endopeptidase MepM/ murein hydrolase activator NlpD
MLRNKNLLRVLLILTLVFYLSGMKIFHIPDREEPLANTAEQAEVGMGGLAMEITQNQPDPELEGVPLPEEYSRPHMLAFSSYTMQKGDIIGNIAIWTGLNEDTLISVNNIKNTRLMQIGQVIRVPNQDGIYYTVQKEDTLDSVAEKYNTSSSRICTVNELFSDTITPNDILFIPGARMDWVNRQEINGDLFIWPCSGYITSNYGYRIAPFAGSRLFHSGIDIGSPMGSPVKAAMAGRVTQVGYDDSFGNFVMISHHSGYRTFYGHMSVVRVKAGAFVGTGERIGDIGSTGLSTGPHLHFTVYKNGVTVNPRSLMK